MERLRVAARLGIAACVMLLASGVSTADACEDPEVVLSKASARAGELISFTVNNTGAGATFTIVIEGHEVAHGENVSGGPVSGEFRMPNLGDQSFRTFVEPTITHEGSDDVHQQSPWKPDKEFEYVVDSPASEEVGRPVEQPAPPPTTVETPDQGIPRAQVQDPSPLDAGAPPATSRAPRGGADRVGDRSSPSSPNSPTGPVGSKVGRGTGISEAPPVTEAASAMQTSAKQTSAKQTQTRTPAREAALATVRHSAATHPAPERVAAAPRRLALPLTAPARVPAVPAALLVGFALLVLVGMCAAAYVVLRRWGGAHGEASPVAPVPWIPPDVAAGARVRDLAVEAELQEILATEHLKRLDRDHEPAIPEPGEPVRAGPG